MLDKKKIIDNHKESSNDTGSSAVQIALLTARINALAEHMRSNKKDVHSRKGLLDLVARRKSLIAYLKRTNFSTYEKLLSTLGLRK